MRKKDATLKRRVMLSRCEDIFGIIITFLNKNDAPFCARVCRLWLQMLTADTFTALCFDLVHSRDQLLHVAQFPRMQRHERMYKCIGSFGNMHDVCNLCQVSTINNLPIWAVVMIVDGAMRRLRFAFMDDLWAACDEHQKEAFLSLGSIGAVFAEDIRVFEWINAHNGPRHV